MDMTKDLLEDYRIQNTVISAYHPQTAGLVERGHGPIVTSLAKYCRDAPASWPKHLLLALWADQISVSVNWIFGLRVTLWGRILATCRVNDRVLANSGWGSHRGP